MKYGIIPTNFIEWLALRAGSVPVPIVDVLFSLMKARTIMAGVRLGVFDALADSERTAADLASTLKLDRECLELLLRALVASEYLNRTGDRYGLSRLSRDTLIAGGTMEQFGYVRWNYTQWDLIARMEEVVRTGRGADFHTTLTDAHAWRDYQRAMLETARIDAPIVAARVPVPDGAASLLDLAGGAGLIGAAICRRHPPLRSRVIDLPQAIAHARPLAEAEGLRDLVEHCPGDIMTGPLGDAADVIVLSNVLHHFGPEQNAALLGRVRAATKPRGTVAIWEIEAPAGNAPPTPGDAVALFFKVTSSACAYHAGAYASWLERSGFGDIRISRPLRKPGSVLVTARAT